MSKIKISNTSVESKRPELVFDFDGTIADTYDFVYDIAEDIVKDFHLGELTPEMMEQARDLPLKQALKFLGFRGFRLMLVSRKFQRYLYERLDQLKPVQGIKPVLEELSKRYTLGIMSSNGAYIIRDFLKEYDLEYFSFIEGGISLNGKAGRIKSMLRKRKLECDEMIYVGDEIRDIQGARGAGVRIISVTWGYNSIKALAGYEPDFIVESPDQILKLNLG